MKRFTRAMLAAGLLATRTAAAQAQNYGMPVFTNPLFGGGIRLHVDAGQASDEASAALTDQTTVQGGISFSASSFALQALVAGNWGDIQNCNSSTATIDCSQTTVSGSVLGAFRLLGGGSQSMALAVFGGVGTDIRTVDLGTGVDAPRLLTIPVGVSIGARLGPLMVWGAPRYNVTRWTSCDSAQWGTLCDEKGQDFRWAVGVALPLGPFGIRAAYDGGKIDGQDRSFIGLGVSLGLGSHQ
jgi:hypothetical protein